MLIALSHVRVRALLLQVNVPGCHRHRNLLATDTTVSPDLAPRGGPAAEVVGVLRHGARIRRHEGEVALPRAPKHLPDNAVVLRPVEVHLREALRGGPGVLRIAVRRPVRADGAPSAPLPFSSANVRAKQRWKSRRFWQLQTIAL